MKYIYNELNELYTELGMNKDYVGLEWVVPNPLKGIPTLPGDFGQEQWNNIFTNILCKDDKLQIFNKLQMELPKLGTTISTTKTGNKRQKLKDLKGQKLKKQKND